ncbi:DUF6907 domain-containing protein [Actinacidiphila glaucinigra]|uniref:DUF6907 domain-containing protein n=1 Tax=Actinacidiphila glaucinigra TaxID=235986 RepID=UPI0037238152
MSRRTVTLETADYGEVQFVCPDWCVMDHRSGGYLQDIGHVAAEERFEVPTSMGPATVQVGQGRYEYGTPERTVPYLSLDLDGVVYPERVGQLEEFAQALEALAVMVRDLLPRLMELQAEGRD